MVKEGRVFLVFMIIIYLSTTPGYVKGEFVIPFPKLRQRQKASTWIYTQTLIRKRSDDQLLVKLNYLTRNIKLKNVIRRFDVSKIIINFDISRIIFLIMMFET